MNRRDLIQRVVLGSTVLVIAPSILESCSKGSSNAPGGNLPTKIVLDLTLAANSALNGTGGWLITQDVIIINTGGGSFSALSSICTHQGCSVAYNSGAGNIQCPCHGSVFSTTGGVLNGPASRALQSYPYTLDGNILTITI
jgi:cytochrome b6-f complex iron-sulfur subunit